MTIFTKEVGWAIQPAAVAHWQAEEPEATRNTLSKIQSLCRYKLG